MKADRTVYVYNSLGKMQRNERYTTALTRYLMEKERHNGTPPPGPWTVIDRSEDAPRQHNGYDCGVFTILTCTYSHGA